MTADAVGHPSAAARRFGPGEIVTGLSGLVLVGLMFVPWFVWIASSIAISLGGQTRNPGGNLSAWAFFGGMAYLLLFTAILALVLAWFRRNLPAKLGTALSLVVAGLGLVLLVLTLKDIVAPPLVDARRGPMILMNVKSAPVLGAYLGALAALGIALGGLLSFRSSRGSNPSRASGAA